MESENDSKIQLGHSPSFPNLSSMPSYNGEYIKKKMNIDYKFTPPQNDIEKIIQVNSPTSESLQQTYTISQNELQHSINPFIEDENNINNDENTHMTFINILINLKLLSHVKEYDKLTIYDDKLDIDKRYFRDIMRRIRGESHVDTLNFIEKLVKSAEYHSIKLMKSGKQDDLHDLKLLTNDLEACQTGLNNLKVTYKSYNVVICKIDIYLEQIKTRIIKNK
jgi:hypothetical protein